MEENREWVPRDPRQIDDPSVPTGRSRPSPSETLLQTVANEHRRAVLSLLRRAPHQTLEFDVLADRVAERLWDEDALQVPDEQHQRIQIALHHTHLPKLDEFRFIDYEIETGHVRFVGGDVERDLLALFEQSNANE